MLVALLALVAAAPPPRSFDQERLILSRRLETLRRILPDGREARRDVALLEGIAAEADVATLRAVARPEAADEPRHVVVDIEGEATYADIDRLFGRLALSHRLIDVARLTLDATPTELIRFTAVVRVPFHPLGTPLPAPPEGLQELLRGVPVSVAEAFRRDEALALLKSDAIARLRRARRNPRLFLAETAAIVRDRPVLLNHATLGDEFVVRGLTVGEGPARALEGRFERGFFRVDEFLMAVTGACHRFEARGQAPVAGPDAELPLPSVDPFRLEEAPCRVDRDPGTPRLIKAGNPRAGGPLTLRLRDVDLADAFRVLHDLSGQGFIVDGDVRGRVDLELIRVTLEEALGALRSAGVELSPPGLIRRVSRPGRVSGAAPSDAETTAAAEDVTRVSFSLKRADLRELLGVMAELDPELTALGPRSALGHLSLYVRELPLRLVRSAVLDAGGLVERIEEQRVLTRSSGAGEVLAPIVDESPPRTLVLRPEDLTLSEFDLAGVASSAGAWRTYAYSVTGALHAYPRGARLADARIREIATSDVQLESGDGALRLFIAPP